jgi:chemotaxis family two-component system response regulator Rcp1
MLRLLLAEDNPGDVRLVKEALRTSPVLTDLTLATDGEAALRYLRNSRFDLVILDLNLPKRHGQNILQLCAATDEAPPFVVCSSSLRQSDRELAFLVGAKEYVAKPTDLDEFIKAIQSIVDRWGNHRGK